MQYQILEWDSGFFGLTVARINPPNLNAGSLSSILAELKLRRVRLVCWPSAERCEESLISGFGGRLVDRKTTFTIDLRTLDFDTLIPTDIVEPYSGSTSLPELDDLAIQSGEYSRFALDPNLPPEKFVALYKLWIERSVRKEMAAEVMVIKSDSQAAGRIAAMITLGIRDGWGEIGLIAVDRAYRGRQYGEKLVRAGQKWLVQNGYETGRVVTQGQNLPACNLYAKCGYRVEKVEYFYHFWL